MRTIRILYSIARADFLERVRTYGFLLTLAGAAFLSYQVHLGNIGILIGNRRGTMNSAWLGAVITLVVTLFLSLFGFYVVKNSIARDTRTGVGQILAATPVSRTHYVFGKAISNFAVLASVVLLLGIAAPGLQLLAGEDSRVDLWALLAPFLLIALPAMTLTAALAILFESVRWLSGVFGNFAYIMLFNGLVLMTNVTGFADPTGMSVFRSDMVAAARRADASYNGSFGFGGGPRRPVRGFEWNGIDWGPSHAAQSLVWPFVSIAVCALAAFCFNRFDSQATRRYPARADRAVHAPVPVRMRVRTHPLSAATKRRSAAFALANELRLMLLRKPWWWYSGAAVAVAAGALAPANALGYVLAFAWIWPLLLWSQMGGREAASGTDQLVFSAPHPLRRQLPATWLAGVGLALVMASGVGVRMLMNWDWAGLGALATAALLPPSLALCLGVWSGGSKLFEVVYTLWWYVGPVSRLPVADFTFSSANAHFLSAYMVGITALVVFAFAGRHILTRFR